MIESAIVKWLKCEATSMKQPQSCEEAFGYPAPKLSAWQGENLSSTAFGTARTRFADTKDCLRRALDGVVEKSLTEQLPRTRSSLY